MYTIRKAAAIFGVPQETFKGWMKRYGIEGRLIETDRKRRYLTHSDMLKIMDQIDQKMAKKESRARKKKGVNAEMAINEVDTHDQKNNASGPHSMVEAASLLGVSVCTVKNWVKQHGIEQEIVITDRKRVYISHDDLLRLANLHGRQISTMFTDSIIGQEDNATQPDMDKLYSISEVAFYLNASYDSVHRWIKQDNIEQKVQSSDRRRTYITYNDMLRLANLHKWKLVPHITPANFAEELKELRNMALKLASDIEDLKHDFRIYVKRSVYVG